MIVFNSLQLAQDANIPLLGLTRGNPSLKLEVPKKPAALRMQWGQQKQLKTLNWQPLVASPCRTGISKKTNQSKCKMLQK